MSHICMAAWKIPRAFCPHPGPPKLTNQFDHVGEIWFSHDWSHSEIPQPLPRSLLIHGGFCMETPDIATKEFHSKGLGVGKKKHGMFKTKSFKRAKHYVEIYIPAMMWWDVSFLETVSRRCQGVSFQLWTFIVPMWDFGSVIHSNYPHNLKTIYSQFYNSVDILNLYTENHGDLLGVWHWVKVLDFHVISES